VTLRLVLATLALFVGGPLLIGFVLSLHDRCRFCHRRVDGEPHWRAPGRGAACNPCTQSLEPEGPE
jgi:hypothetical protein